jgi:hypothetical protein
MSNIDEVHSDLTGHAERACMHRIDTDNAQR